MKKQTVIQYYNWKDSEGEFIHPANTLFRVEKLNEAIELLKFNSELTLLRRRLMVTSAWQENRHKRVNIYRQLLKSIRLIVILSKSYKNSNKEYIRHS